MSKKSLDVWITRCDHQFMVAVTAHGQAPTESPIPVKSIHDLYRVIKRENAHVVQMGICPPEMLGLE